MLAEVYAATTRELTEPLSREDAAAVVESLAELTVVGADARLILSAIELAIERMVSSWDALIVRAAQRGGCDLLLSEDMQDGALFDAVRIKNPFEPR